ncbi:hypothetical protein [Nocardiopsis gilva]|uniref:hypothetical protein n=1 Tax=Nocardiopsis gilva TaxID=280236 RepID=UPI0012FE3113|nr:hypothetical protein [Nocardiopsis gilva]
MRSGNGVGRRLPRVNALLLAVLRSALAPRVAVGTRIPGRMRYPFVLARRVGGAAPDPRLFYDVALVDVQVWATSDAEAEDIAQQSRGALADAARPPQWAFPGLGHIQHFSEEAAPVDIPSDAEDHGIYRYQATYTLTVRPPRAA